MRKVQALLLIVVVGVVMVGGAARGTSAQENALDPLTGGALLDILAIVPDTEGAREYLAFSDFAAADAANPALARFESTDAYLAAERERRRDVALHIPVYGMPSARTLNEMIPEMPAAIGIDFFQFDRAVSWGIPPDYTYILQGDFSADAIADAHSARDYTSTTVTLGGLDFTLWCGAVGCENGTRVDVRGRLVGNIFGGEIGRQFPFVVTGNTIVASPVLDHVQDAIGLVIDAHEGEAESSLASVPEYRAIPYAIHALIGERGYLLREAVLFDAANPEGAVPRIEDGLPPYEVLAIADAQLDDQFMGIALFSYADVDAAYDSVEILEPRFVSEAQGTLAEAVRVRAAQVIEVGDGAVVALTLTSEAPLDMQRRGFSYLYLSMIMNESDWAGIDENGD